MVIGSLAASMSREEIIRECDISDSDIMRRTTLGIPAR
jgi:hypothetical protein